MLGLSSFWTLVYNPSLSKYKLKHDWKFKPIILLEKIVSSCFPPQHTIVSSLILSLANQHISQKKKPNTFQQEETDRQLTLSGF